MSFLFQRLSSYTRIQSPSLYNVRKSFEETREIIRLLEDLIAALGAGSDRGPATNIITNNLGPQHRDLGYEMVIDASSDLFPNGAILDATKAMKITAAEMYFDPQVVASAATTFVLQNAATGPTSTGGITIATGTNYKYQTGLGVIIGIGQRLHVRAPAALNDLQRAKLAVWFEQA